MKHEKSQVVLTVELDTQKDIYFQICIFSSLSFCLASDVLLMQIFICAAHGCYVNLLQQNLGNLKTFVKMTMVLCIYKQQVYSL